MQHQVSAVHTVTTVGSGTVAVEWFSGSQLTARGNHHAKLPSHTGVWKGEPPCVPKAVKVDL